MFFLAEQAQVETGALIGMLIFGLAFYAYFALAISTIAKKTNTPNGWMAWVPILNAVLILNIAGKPVWWIVLALVPFVNIIFFILMIIAWMAIAEKRGKPTWWGILMIVPFVGLIVPGVLAWSE